MKLIPLRVDVNKQLDTDLINIVQGDSNGFLVNLIDSGVPFDLAEGNIVSVIIVKPDNVPWLGYGSIEDVATGLIELELDTQVTAVLGTCLATVEIYTGTAKLTSARFSFNVISSLNTLGDLQLQSLPEYPLLTQVLTDMANVKSEVLSVKAGTEMAADAASDAAEEAITAAEAAIAAAQTALNSKGPKGDPGAQGPEGPRGEIGAEGPKGDIGPIGVRGPQGIQGIQGAAGVAGPQGPTGPIGARGIEGLKGETGATGAVGPQGIRGLVGLQGPQGATGKSAYEIAVQNGFLGNELDWTGVYLDSRSIKNDLESSIAAGTTLINAVINANSTAETVKTELEEIIEEAEEAIIQSSISVRVTNVENVVISHKAENVQQFNEIDESINALDENKADKTEVNSLATNKADKTYVDTLAASLASGSPKGVYATLLALQTALPTGNTNVYVVDADKKWYYWNGSAWTAGGTYITTLENSEDTRYAIQPDVYLTNNVPNGNFDTTTGFDPATPYSMPSTLSVASNTLTVTGTTKKQAGVRTSGTVFALNKKYYVKARVRVTNADCKFIYFGQGTILTAQLITDPVQNQWYDISVVIETVSVVHDFLMFYHEYVDDATGNGKVMEVEYIVATELTTPFESGNEPTATEMSTTLTQFANSWFDSTQRVLLSKLQNGDILYIENDVLGYKTLTDVINTQYVQDSFTPTIELTNIPPNSDFSNSTTGWFKTPAYGKDSTISVTSNTLSVTGTVHQGVAVISGNDVFEINKKYYVKARVRVTNSDCEFIRIAQGDILTIKQIDNPNQNEWYIIDGIIDTVSVVHSFLNIYHWYVDAATALDKVMEVQYVVVTNLTAPLGTSVRPLTSQIRTTLEMYDEIKLWFDDTKILDASALYNGRLLSIKNNAVSFGHQSNLTGKTWVAIGDSLTEINARTDKNYHSYIYDWVGGCTIGNYGIGGTGWFTQNEAEADNAIYQRISSLPSSADLITVFAGTNDWAEVLKPLVLGTLGDTDGSVSFYGAVDSTLSQLITKYPTSTIMVFTPIPRANAFSSPNASGITLKQVADAIIDVCGKYGIPVLDLYRNSSLFPWNSTANATYFSCIDSPTGDGLHPNTEGHRILAYKIMDFLNSNLGMF